MRLRIPTKRAKLDWRQFGRGYIGILGLFMVGVLSPVRELARGNVKSGLVLLLAVIAMAGMVTWYLRLPVDDVPNVE